MFWWNGIWREVWWWIRYGGGWSMYFLFSYFLLLIIVVTSSVYLIKVELMKLPKMLIRKLWNSKDVEEQLLVHLNIIVVFSQVCKGILWSKQMERLLSAHRHIETYTHTLTIHNRPGTSYCYIVIQTCTIFFFSISFQFA